MKLNNQHKDILKRLIKSKGVYRTRLIPVEERDNIFDSLFELYMAEIVQFSKKSELEFEGPYKEPRYKCFEVKLWPKVSLDNIKKAVKNGVYA